MPPFLEVLKIKSNLELDNQRGIVMSAKKEKKFWENYFGINDPADAPGHLSRLSYKETEFGDQELCFLCERLEVLDQLDLDYTEVTEKGLECLLQLSSISELRLKGLKIDDSCLVVLAKLETLELLHLGETQISCEGILQLIPLKNLQKLLLTPQVIAPEPLNEFSRRKPECELIIDYRNWK